MNKEEFLTKVWGYYNMLESNFIDTFKYVEPTNENDKVFSKEYNKLLLSICSEIDVLCKELCKFVELKTQEQVKKYNIDNYKEVILKEVNFINEKCIYLVSNEVLEPWIEWSNGINPKWWKDYNKLKHDRLNSDNYKLGNYLNVRDALAGLYILARILYKKQFSLEPVPKSNLFRMQNWTIYNEIGNGFYYALDKEGGMGLNHMK